MASFCHWEIPANDVERAKKFYQNVFDWKFNKYPDMEYWLFSTKNWEGKEGVGGGLYKRMKNEGIIFYIDSEDIEKQLNQIEKKGGKIIEKKTAIPSVGYYGVFEDTEGNKFSLYTSDRNAK